MRYLYTFVQHCPAVWSENDETWDERRISWKTIGSQLIQHPREVALKNDKLKILLDKFFNENFFLPKVCYFVIEYKSGRLDVGYDSNLYEPNAYVILEADRGEDCGKILGITSESRFNFIYHKLKEAANEIEAKKILRYATDEDIYDLVTREQDEIDSLEKCRDLVTANNINMEILSCEYQWDKKKITFYFRSSKRIDFRELLKDLFKLFKIRIWLCAEKKSINILLKSLLD
ncbi:hypothetical protein NCER_100777 [Vairimorpha ceranae BRL01]|uniref:PSP1 C-terminal domain-containing protein n=2 Tax=Vairimorpha ceranae TaxID=40302 RepID=C4V8F8_VAIC1|nr:signal peptidase-like protein [Vairimorpha ceranae]EEQ82487.1 hypothetical protein NCER_100777 [Vairimorpha ceranae BRL01]KAF5140433.1 hypothetical protein G9O61_00g012380 [Vairimorpha ceranae]KKO75667.1 signal peptidase-like protein [Vairimorpha ceranae]